MLEAPPSPDRGRISAKAGLGWLAQARHSVRAALAFLVIGVVGFLGLNQLREQAREIVQDTLPGLAYAVEANTSAGQAFNYTMLLLLNDDSGRRTAFRRQIEECNRRSETCFQAYEASIFQADDRMNFDRCMEQRQNYVRLRGQVFELVENNQKALAVSKCQNELLPAYQLYSDSLTRLSEYNIRQGHERGHAITSACTITRWSVAAVAVLLFALGFWAGLFK